MAPYEELGFVVALLAFVSLTVWTIARYFSARAAERDRRSRVVEEQIARFANADSFVAFARSGAGREWLLAETGAARVMTGALTLGVTGVLVAAVGTGLFLFGAGWLPYSHAADSADLVDAVFWGCVLLPTGVAMAGSSVITLRVGRAWGLLPSDRSRDRA